MTNTNVESIVEVDGTDHLTKRAVGVSIQGHAAASLWTPEDSVRRGTLGGVEVLVHHGNLVGVT